MSARFNNISWPSLYSPVVEVGFIGPPVRLGGYYLSNLDDIFRFTLYWTLIFHLPFNFVAGVYAFFNFLFPPARTVRDPIALVSPAEHRSHSRSLTHTPSFSQSHPRSQLHPHSHSRSPSQPYSHSHSCSHSQTQPPDKESPPRHNDEWLKPPRLNARRSRLTFALLVFFVFLIISLLSAVVGAAVLSFVIVGVYSAGGLYVSTWIPFLWAVIQSLVALLEIWPSVIDII